jgi:hypothetical protein
MEMTEQEQIIAFEIARVALHDADVFDAMADSLDMTDEEMLNFREKLEEKMNGPKGIKRLTYRDLYRKIEKMSEYQKDMDVTMFDPNDEEYYALCKLSFTDETDVLDKQHPYLHTFEVPSSQIDV